MSNDETRDERIKELEDELIKTRAAAVSIAVGMADAIIKTQKGREELAEGFDIAAEGADEVTARLARSISVRIREG